MATGPLTDLRNRRFTAYTLKCLVIIYMAAIAAALQSVFEIRKAPSRHFFNMNSLIFFSMIKYAHGRQRILFDDEQKFFVDGEAGSQDATAKKRPCHERRAILYKTGTAPGQGRCRNAYGKAERGKGLKIVTFERIIFNNQ